jgi:hypothetical protein
VTHFAVIDLDQDGPDAVLMLVPDEADAEAIAVILRENDVRADVVEVDRTVPTSTGRRVAEAPGTPPTHPVCLTC